MSMFNDIVWDAKGNDELCEHNSMDLGTELPKLSCSVSHMTTLFVFTCVMIVRYQTIQAFVTGFGPLRDRSCKFVR